MICTLINAVVSLEMFDSGNVLIIYTMPCVSMSK